MCPCSVLVTCPPGSGICNNHPEPVDIFIDRRHPFGLCSSGGNLGLALDATIEILSHILIVWFWAKWIDDIVTIHRCCADGSYNVHFADILCWFKFVNVIST